MNTYNLKEGARLESKAGVARITKIRGSRVWLKFGNSPPWKTSKVHIKKHYWEKGCAPR